MKTNKNFSTKEELASALSHVGNGSVLIADITARCAAQIVDAENGWNMGNRRLEEPLVDKFKRDMDRDEFLDMSDLFVGSDGPLMKLGDGQHRLSAQARSGKTIRYVVKFYSNPADFAQAVTKVDCGKPRTKADLVKVLGMNDAAFQQYERIVSAMLKFEGKRASRLTNVEWISYSEKFSKSIKWALSLPWRQFKAHVLAALVFAHAKSKTVAEQTIAQVISGVNLTADSPPLVLKNQLAMLNEAKNDETRFRSMVFVMRAMNDARSGRGTTVNRVKRTRLFEEAVRFYAGADAANRFMKAIIISGAEAA